jgi:hypothetical protein
MGLPKPATVIIKPAIKLSRIACWPKKRNDYDSAKTITKLIIEFIRRKRDVRNLKSAYLFIGKSQIPYHAHCRAQCKNFNCIKV